MVRTRIAPSPTGYPHIGTIYQALFNFAFAKKNNGTFFIRIEDTDRARFVEGAEEVIFEAIDWFGLTENESSRKGGKHGPYRQSERLEIYHKHAQALLDKDLAYFAYYPKGDAGQKKEYTRNISEEKKETTEIPPKTIAEMIRRGDWILRMRVPKDKETTVHDEIRGDIVFTPDQVTEQVLVKSDGFPTYHLAAIVDDHLMGVTHVVRGEEWISSAPKHVLLYQYFGWEIPLLFHTPLLRNPDKSKLSKRHGHTDVRWYQEEGYLPEAILNFLALMGWTHPEEKEIFSMEEFISLFELKAIRQVGPIFDLTKLTWMNGEYIRKMDRESLVATLKEFYTSTDQSLDSIDKKTLVAIVSIAHSRIATLKEFYPLISHFLPEAQFHVNTLEDKKIVGTLQDEFIKIDKWNKETILEALRVVLKTHSIRMPILYTIITGHERGLPLPESLEILGKETTLDRLDKALS
ncbi:MAG: glutamate--tRNA ligase [Candidatus Levyibacteriota bacterium]